MRVTGTKAFENLPGAVWGGVIDHQDVRSRNRRGNPRDPFLDRSGLVEGGCEYERVSHLRRLTNESFRDGSIGEHLESPSAQYPDSVPGHDPISVSVVIPVYRGAHTLPGLIDEIVALDQVGATPAGRSFAVHEILLVWDNGADDSPAVMRALAERHPRVRCVWLTRNFGQHAATLAGMTSSQGSWIVTMDEDGQHDPAFIPALLDTAYAHESLLVYATPDTSAPHAAWRNVTSRTAKALFMWMTPGIPFDSFSSFRLVEGGAGRSAAAYTGPGAYLDVSLGWVTNGCVTLPVPMRTEGRPSGSYSLGRLIGHFGRMAVAAGTRPLLYVSLLGVVIFLVGVVVAGWVLISLALGASTPTGWASTFVALTITGGLTLLALGVIAQYLRASTEAALGRPLYVLGSDPHAIFRES